PTSHYTYAAELSVDEAVEAGATEVRFGQPVPLYLENILGVPVGGIVPVGFYDRSRGVWKASPNGQVIRILGASGALADLDTTGDGAPDDAAMLLALGITEPERGRLATLYQPGQTLWRVPLSHFSPVDLNWPAWPAADATPPMVPPPD